MAYYETATPPPGDFKRIMDDDVGQHFLSILIDDQDLPSGLDLTCYEPTCEFQTLSETVTEPAMLSSLSVSSTINDHCCSATSAPSWDENSDISSSTSLSTATSTCDFTETSILSDIIHFVPHPAGEIETSPYFISDELLSELANYISECDGSFVHQSAALSDSGSDVCVMRSASYTSSAESCEGSIPFDERPSRRQKTFPAENTSITSKSKGKRTRRCRVESCEADLTDAMPYNKRRRVCLACMTIPIIRTKSLNSLRFCQQCGSLHELDKFDSDKRSCRKTLRRHRVARLSM